MRSSNTCCASGNQLVGDELLYISSVYVHERAVKSFKLPDYYVVYLLIPTFIVSNHLLSIGSNSCSSIVKYGSFLYGSDDCFNLRILPVFPLKLCLCFTTFQVECQRWNKPGGGRLSRKVVTRWATSIPIQVPPSATPATAMRITATVHSSTALPCWAIRISS